MQHGPFICVFLTPKPLQRPESIQWWKYKGMIQDGRSIACLSMVTHQGQPVIAWPVPGSAAS